MALMSQRAYARHRGVALFAVQKAIKSGRISTMPDGRIDSDAADEEWSQNTREYAPAVSRTKDVDDDGIGVSASAYSKARAIREQYQARLSKIEYEERVGKLVSKDEVQVAAFNKFREFRDHMLTLPDRLASMLAAETEDARVYEVLASEIRKALNEFSNRNA